MKLNVGDIVRLYDGREAEISYLGLNDIYIHFDGRDEHIGYNDIEEILEKNEDALDLSWFDKELLEVDDTDIYSFPAGFTGW